MWTNETDLDRGWRVLLGGAPGLRMGAPTGGAGR